MKKIFYLLFIFMAFGCQQKKKHLSTGIDSLSFYSGFFNAEIAKDYYYKFNSEAYKKGMDEVLSNEKGFESKEFAISKIEMLMDSLEMKRADFNYKKGESFLKINSTHKEIIKTSSRLQYKVEKFNSNGQKFNNSSKVLVKVKASSIDNFIFLDTSTTKGDTIEVDKQIIGFREGLQLMTEGSKYKFYIPTELAYGPTPPPNTPIKPMMPVIFEVELIKVIK